ncbi:hypothetical protein B0G81_0868 [Paraburkholderia sp. BL6665CI2N2]|nr:hypothetical protein B0G81_0868 [Paraburkholderia sp. BL6665CI2N2]
MANRALRNGRAVAVGFTDLGARRFKADAARPARVRVLTTMSSSCLTSCNGLYGFPLNQNYSLGCQDRKMPCAGGTAW